MWDLLLQGWFVYLTTAAIILLYLRLKWRHSYWSRRGVPSTDCNLIFGNFNEFLFKGKNIIEFHQNIYKQGVGHPYIGFYMYQRPSICIRDIEMIKNIFTKDFNYFMDRGLNLHNEAEPLTDHLFNMKGERWRKLRKKLTPTFTSGKIKSMFVFIKECCKQLDKAVSESISESEGRDLMARYTTDIISSCAFGVVTDSVSNPESEFRRMGARIFTYRLEHIMRVALNDTFLKFLLSVFGARFFEIEVTNFFTNSVHQMVKYREDNGIVRGDFLDLLIAMKNEHSENHEHDTAEMNITTITAQCFLFFAAGFETSSTTLSFCLLELAANQDVQQKLQEEIDQHIKDCETDMTYETLQHMPYLEKVISETLRKYPPLFILTRKCTQDYQIPGTKTVLEKGIEVIVPVYAIHHDPLYYPNPEVFNPENFSEEAKSSRPAFAYLPFGEGPRNCIGMRFGQIQVKAAIVTLLKNYSVQLSARTTYPVKFVKISFVTNTLDGIWLKFIKRK